MALATPQKSTSNQRKGLFNYLFSKGIREIRCQECGRPFLEHPRRVPTSRFVSGNVELFMYEQKTAFRKNFVFRVGSWKILGDDFVYRQLFDLVDVFDLQLVVRQAIEFIDGCDIGSKKDASEENEFFKAINKKQ